MLRSWQEVAPSAGDAAVWRYAIEDPETRQRRGFATLRELMRFLELELGPDATDC